MSPWLLKNYKPTWQTFNNFKGIQQELERDGLCMITSFNNTRLYMGYLYDCTLTSICKPLILSCSCFRMLYYAICLYWLDHKRYESLRFMLQSQVIKWSEIADCLTFFKRLFVKCKIPIFFQLLWRKNGVLLRCNK